MALRVLALILLVLAAPIQACTGSPDCRSPDGPSQQCSDDAGPPWVDDEEHFGSKRYHEGTPATPVLANGECPDPLATSCATKGIKSAHLDGPIDCGGSGWFCRILPQEGWVPEGGFRDSNFAHCSTPNADEKDTDGHCHGSANDGTYGWWARDHWFRGYAGTLHCCCGWGEPMHGVVNRCDYRKFVTRVEVDTCRDANEEHNVDFGPTCETHALKADPLDATPSQCWTVTHFADPGSVPGSAPPYSEPPSARGRPPRPAPPPPPALTLSPPPPSPSPPPSLARLPPPPSPSPPPPDTSYTMIADGKDCCRYNGEKIRGYARRPDPADCEAKCDARRRCTHFSHSTRYYGGLCILCSACDHSGEPGNGQYYTSWEKKLHSARSGVDAMAEFEAENATVLYDYDNPDYDVNEDAEGTTTIVLVANTSGTENAATSYLSTAASGAGGVLLGAAAVTGFFAWRRGRVGVKSHEGVSAGQPPQALKAAVSADV